MKLPLAPTSHTLAFDQAARAVRRAYAVLSGVLAEEHPAPLRDGRHADDADEPPVVATAFIAPDLPRVHQANWLCDLAVPPGIDPGAALDSALRTFADRHARCHLLRPADAHPDATLLAAAAAHGFTPRHVTLYRWPGGILDAPAQPPVQLIPSRAAYDQLRALALVHAHEIAPDDNDLQQQLVRHHVRRHDEPRLESFLARLDGSPVGSVQVLSLGPIGVVVELYVVPDARRRGIGLRLLAAAVEYARRAQFESLILDTACDNSPARSLYDRAGFVALGRVAELRPSRAHSAQP